MIQSNAEKDGNGKTFLRIHATVEANNPYRAPTIIWQMTFSYLYGPYVLYTIRKIDDEYHWRLQTTIVVIAAYVEGRF